MPVALHVECQFTVSRLERFVDFLWDFSLFSPLFDHLEEGGVGLKPYCDLLPGGKFGAFFQRMQNLFFYMLMLSNKHSIDDQVVWSEFQSNDFSLKFYISQQVKDGLEVNEISDFMRGLGFFPSDYEVECFQHELQTCGKRKISFEDLVKLFINHSRAASNGGQNECLETSMRKLLNSSDGGIVVEKSRIISILTESAEKIGEKDADMYLKEIFRNGKSIDGIPLSDFMHEIAK